MTPPEQIETDEVNNDSKRMFVQLDILSFKKNTNELEWREKARWIKFEEDVNKVTDSFTMVHYPVIRYNDVLCLQQYLEKSIVLVDIKCGSIEELVLDICTRLSEEYDCSIEEVNSVQSLLLLRHVFVGEKLANNSSKIGSNRAINETETSSHGNLNQKSVGPILPDELPAQLLPKNLHVRRATLPANTHGSKRLFPSISRKVSIALAHSNCKNTPSTIQLPMASPRVFHSDLDGRLKDGFYESTSVQVGYLDTLERPLMICGQLGGTGLNGKGIGDGLIRANHLTEVGNEVSLRFIILFVGPKMNSTTGKLINYFEMGRVFSTMMSNEIFRASIYKAQNSLDVFTGSQIFLDSTLILPVIREASNPVLGGIQSRVRHYIAEKSDCKTINRRRGTLINRDMIGGHHMYHMNNETVSVPLVSPSNVTHHDFKIGDTNLPDQINVDGSIYQHKSHPRFISHKRQSSSDSELSQSHSDQYISIHSLFSSNDKAKCHTMFCPPFICFLRDVVGYTSRFQSDITDAFIKENLFTVLLGILFVYFTVLAPAITFGALLNNLVSPNFSVGLCLVASGIFQFLFALFGGQPFIIVGVTGPVFIIETAISLKCKSMDIEIAVVRFWVAIYTSLFSLVIIGFNLVQVVRFIRRSVEEVFNCFVGIYFIFKSMVTMLRLIPASSKSLQNSTLEKNNETFLGSNASLDRIFLADVEEAELHFARSRAAATLLLAFFMLSISMKLSAIRSGKCFTRSSRNIIGALNVPLGIIFVVVVERLLFSDFMLPKLNIPPISTVQNASFMVHPANLSSLNDAKVSAEVHGFAFAVGICLAVLICTETMISGVTAAKAERKLKKPCLFALDFFMCMVLFPIISGLLGWPFVTGAVVRSVSHVMAMTKWDLKTLPGMPHVILGCAEQRISGLTVGVLVTLSVLLGNILGLIPTAAMYGMFLYMGVMGLRDLLLVRRLVALMQHNKHWMGRSYLANLTFRHVGILVAIQMAAIVILVICNCVTEFARFAYTSFAFPVVLLVYALVREFVMPHYALINNKLEEMDPRHKIVLSKANFGAIKTIKRLYKQQKDKDASSKMMELSNEEIEKEDDNSADGDGTNLYG